MSPSDNPFIVRRLLFHGRYGPCTIVRANLYIQARSIDTKVVVTDSAP